MTPTEARIEELARLVHSCDRDGWDSYNGMPEKHKIVCRNTARALYIEIMSKDAAQVANDIIGPSSIALCNNATPATLRSQHQGYWNAGVDITAALEAKAREAESA